MKQNKMKFLAGAALFFSFGLFGTSCSDMLDLEPEDYYGSGSYWKNEAQVIGYVDGLHKHLRDAYWNHTIVFGEMRGGHYRTGSSCDGNALGAGDVISQNFDEDHTGVSNFGDIYGRITNCNLLIARVTDADFMPEDRKNYCLAIAYGLRAFYYFDLYRVYGGVPLRTDVAVIDGVLDPIQLYKPRANASEVMKQIKEDVHKSIELFGNQSGFDVLGRGKKVYWNKAASECLAADVYLWNAKVTTGDQSATEADLAEAKKYLNNVKDNYGLVLLDNFADIFEAQSHKGNDEIVFAIRFADGEAANNNGYYTYSVGTGHTHAQGFREDGSPWNDPLGLKTGYMQSYEYKTELFKSFDNEDTRKYATFMPSFRKDEAGELVLYGTHVVKNIGYINSNGNRVMCGDYICYRLPWVYLSLAEIANMENNNDEVKKYIDLVRERAYGDNWDAATYGYVPGDFTKNELAILKEKDKEFVQEGQRWWDIRRMTLTKGGKALVFCKEASIGSEEPILAENESYKVLWPINKGVMSNDSTIVQTPGYK